MFDTTKSLSYSKYYNNVTDNINLQSHFDAYRKVIKSSDFHEHFDKKKVDMMHAVSKKSKVNERLWNDLAKHCDIDNLTVDGELEKMTKSTYEVHKDDINPSFLENVQLQTVKNSILRNKIPRTSLRYWTKHRAEQSIFYEISDDEPTNLDTFLEPENDIFVYVRVHKPYQSNRYSSMINCMKVRSQPSSVTHCTVIALHGSQTLDKLKDKIFCHSDNSVSKEMSENPVRVKVPNAKDVYKSGFFFIENTFYNDFRDPTNKDNSKVIRDWAEGHNYGTFSTAKMEETKIGSLTFKFGYPYVYQHQGDCEHIIIFSNARLVNPTDELNTNCYPRIVRIKPQRAAYCMTCGLYNVTWVVTRNKRLPHDPCLFCDFCFRSYNYIGGKKIGNFQAHPFPYDSDSQLVQPCRF